MTDISARDRINSLTELARQAETRGEWTESLSLILEALRISDDHFGLNNTASDEAQGMLAYNYRYQGRYEEAEKLDRIRLVRRQEMFGEEHRLTAMCTNNLALDLKGQGRYAEALELEERVLGMMTKLQQGQGNGKVMTSMNNLANTYAILGQYGKAAEMHDRALELRIREYGPNHHLTIASQDLLAVDFRHLGQVERALELQEDAVNKARSSLGESHETTTRCMVNLAAIFEAQDTEKSIARAISLLEHALGPFESRQMENTPLTIAMKNNLAMVYAKYGRLDDAKPLLVFCYEWNRQHLGQDNPTTQQASANLTWLLELSGELVRGPVINT
ncbi:hypothetical protein BJX64DRAFT_270145 [Aspergillus heterothallicus]